jgi:hypothetical protein
VSGRGGAVNIAGSVIAGVDLVAGHHERDQLDRWRAL